MAYLKSFGSKILYNLTSTTYSKSYSSLIVYNRLRAKAQPRKLPVSSHRATKT
jgi:hypothetical protein